MLCRAWPRDIAGLAVAVTDHLASVARAGMMTAPVGGHMPAQRLVAERRWRLGVHSRGHPSAIVAELLRALQVLVPPATCGNMWSGLSIRV